MDTAIKALMVLVVLLWIVGGVDLSVGPVKLTIHKTLPLFSALVLLILTRWLVSRSGRGTPFSLSPRWQWFFRRLFEFGIAVQVVMIPVVWRGGDFRSPFFESPDLGRSEGLIILMLLIRFIMGRNLAAWGAGLAPRQRYTDVLQAMLNQALPGTSVEVLNFGLPGGPAVAERDNLEKLHEEVQPDLIVVGFCLNDPQPRSMNYSRERANLHGLYNLIAGLRHVGLKMTYAFLINRINNLFVGMKVIPSWQDSLDRTYRPESNEWQAFEAAQGLGFVVVDPAPHFLAELNASDLPVNPQDGHPSAACNRDLRP